MNLNGVTRHYDKLSVEERFALIVTASGRGDEAEVDRLTASAARITLRVRDYYPYAEAFQDLVEHVFMELMDQAGEYFDALHRAGEAEMDYDLDEDDPPDGAAREAAAHSPVGWDDARAGNVPPGRGRRSYRARQVDLFLAHGYLLKEKVAGWHAWCARRHLPPLLLWECLPGYARLNRALDMTEGRLLPVGGAAFTPEGMVRWLNAVRRKGEEAVTAVPMTADAFATALEQAFRERVRFHGG